MLSYNSLSTSDYQNLRYQVLLATEENGNLKKTAYLDGNNDPTIGIGFNLTAKNIRDAVLKGLGFDVSRTASAAERQYISQIEAIIKRSYGKNDVNLLRSALNDVMARRSQDSRIANRTHTTFAFTNDDEIRAVFNNLIETYETKVNDQLFAGIPNSRERVALVSMAYNTRDGSKSLLGKGLKDALENGNRAEAWYQIRYNSNGNKLPGVAKLYSTVRWYT